MENIKEIIYDSNLYWKLLRLREIVLRLPLGLRFNFEAIEKEYQEKIYAYLMDGNPIATAQFIVEKPTAKMRQVATHPKYQKLGIGMKLYLHTENELKKQGITSIYCHARESAFPFYLKMGFQFNSEMFDEVGIPHRKMIKTI